MGNLRISTMKAAAAQLKRKAKSLDTDRNGGLSPGELSRGRSKVGDVTIHAINKFKTSMVGNRWYGSVTADGLELSALKKGVDLSVTQLKAIDKNKDGVVTPAEIKSYPHGQGKLPHFAQQLVWYAKNK